MAGELIVETNGLAPLPFNFIDLVETRHPDLIWIKGH